jgi:hypothetical protein
MRKDERDAWHKKAATRHGFSEERVAQISAVRKERAPEIRPEHQEEKRAKPEPERTAPPTPPEVVAEALKYAKAFLGLYDRYGYFDLQREREMEALAESDRRLEARGWLNVYRKTAKRMSPELMYVAGLLDVLETAKHERAAARDRIKEQPGIPPEARNYILGKLEGVREHRMGTAGPTGKPK